MDDANPILNNPYEEPLRHYSTNMDGELDYSVIKKGRRMFIPELQAMPVKQGPQHALLGLEDLQSAKEQQSVINLLRKEVGQWRQNYAGVGRVSRELLDFWFNNRSRDATFMLFFAQREAIETAIWLNEIAPACNPGNNILRLLDEGRQEQMSHGGPAAVLPRIAFKMATGTGKTVVMAALILYHFFNRQENDRDPRFSDYFLVVTPGVTIRERLGVLRPNLDDSSVVQDYYRARWLVPPGRREILPNLVPRIVITNFHAFEPRVLQGNKRSPFDGKLDASGKKQEMREDFSLVTRRVIGSFKPGSRLVIMNDEAHHCYLPRNGGKCVEGEGSPDENARAAVWFNGLAEVSRKYKVDTIYDLSATPYYLTGSGFEPYSLFKWVVSDFGLTEAIESGLVKIPFLPESDNTQELTMPVLRNLYEFVKDDLPKKGRRKVSAEAKQEGRAQRETPPNLPSKVRGALDMFYKHYLKDYDRVRGLFDHPPVFIIVCNNTSVSKEVYKFIAGYEAETAAGETIAVPGAFDLFSNFHPETRAALPKPPTLLIDSDALENSGQINDDFKKVFASEIALFKRDYARLHGQGAAEDLSDALILREVVNTVGKTGTLGAHIRCVVSVSMLTEGWDANTVTHVMGIRAFGSQLLCEQVAGRALRRNKYHLMPYDRRTGETIPLANVKRFKPENILWKYPAEYAHIIGIPFASYKRGIPGGGEPVQVTQIMALRERAKEFEITFPNVAGYRVEHRDAPISADFSALEKFRIDTASFPLTTVMSTAFSARTETLTVYERIASLRDQQLIYAITCVLLSKYYRDECGQPQFHRFAQLKRLVEQWYAQHVEVAGAVGDRYKRLLYYEKPERICSHINRGILSASAGTDVIVPVLNYYNRFGSTAHVRGVTTKETYPTRKSHVNFVVADTDSWEQIAAKTLDDMDEVISYVKNAFLDFAVPYVDKEGEDKPYYPDFIARCRRPDGSRVNLIIEITGMNKDKAEKRWYVQYRWLPAVNAMRGEYGMDEWQFVEVKDDISMIKNILLEALQPGHTADEQPLARSIAHDQG